MKLQVLSYHNCWQLVSACFFELSPWTPSANLKSWSKSCWNNKNWWRRHFWTVTFLHRLCLLYASEKSLRHWLWHNTASHKTDSTGGLLLLLKMYQLRVFIDFCWWWFFPFSTTLSHILTFIFAINGCFFKPYFISFYVNNYHINSSHNTTGVKNGIRKRKRGTETHVSGLTRSEK